MRKPFILGNRHLADLDVILILAFTHTTYSALIPDISTLTQTITSSTFLKAEMTLIRMMLCFGRMEVHNSSFRCGVQVMMVLILRIFSISRPGHLVFYRPFLRARYVHYSFWYLSKRRDISPYLMAQGHVRSPLRIARRIIHTLGIRIQISFSLTNPSELAFRTMILGRFRLVARNVVLLLLGIILTYFQSSYSRQPKKLAKI